MNFPSDVALLVNDPPHSSGQNDGGYIVRRVVHHVSHIG
jgi:hypothetical protein